MHKIASGPQPADILILGEAPGENEVKAGQPFIGMSGKELTKMLSEAGILRSECRIMNVTSYRPPEDKIDAFFPTKSNLNGGEILRHGRYCTTEIQQGLMELQREIALTKPKVIIALGDTALWSLTGESSISKWRGSILEHDSGAWIIPTYHPAAILRMWSWRFIAVNDLRRASQQVHSPVREPKWNFITSPSYDTVITYLSDLHSRLNKSSTKAYLSVDIETRSGHIDCIGIAWSTTEALCIPFCVIRGKHYFSLEEEAVILQLLRKVLLHPMAAVVGQNFLYDAMYMAKRWGWYPTPAFDTMIGHAVAFPGLPKALDFLSSLYLPYHRYWKDESKEADLKADDLIRWEYNCKDCCATYGCIEPIMDSISKGNLTEPLNFEMSLFDPLMEMMMRGVKIDTARRSEYALAIMDEQAKLEHWFQDLGEGVWQTNELVKNVKTASAWYNSPTQQRKIFYDLLGMEVIHNRKTKKPTVDDEALLHFGQKEPIMLPIVEKLAIYRSLGVFYSTFVTSELDNDNRVRTKYNPVGTETFRFSSSIDDFGKGMNLQNIPGKKE